METLYFYPFAMFLAYVVLLLSVSAARTLAAKRRVAQAELIDVVKMNAYARAAAGIIDDIVLQFECNKLLQTYFPTELEDRIYRLRATATHSRVGSLPLPEIESAS